jgi:hyperosmotically inducible protein
MMNSSTAHKIVVGVGLAAVFGLGVSVIAARAEHDSQVARNASVAPLAENATDATAPAQGAAAPTLTDPTASPSGAPPAVAPVVAPAPGAATTGNGGQDAASGAAGDQSRLVKSKASDRADRRAAKTRSGGDNSGTRVASAAEANTSSAAESASRSSDSVKDDKELTPAPLLGNTTASAPAAATADALPAPAQTGQAAAKSASPDATSNATVASDSQITTDVKSQVAAAAPNSNVEVTTTNGVVALVGSVPSQDVVEQARQAAQRVAGVRNVDVSALMVSNQ